MAFNESETRESVSFPYSDVFAGLLAAVPAAGYKVKSHDALAGCIFASAGVSVPSWGENITIHVVKTGESSTVVLIRSTLRIAINFTGASKNANNARRIFAALFEYLEGTSATEAAPAAPGQPHWR